MLPLSRFCLWLTFLSAILGLSLPAAADGRAEILKQYHRATEATKLKFIDGVHSIRAPKFRLYNQEGMPLDLGVERTREEQFLAPALEVDEKVVLKSFDQLSHDRAVCIAVFTTTLITLDRLTNKELKQVLITKMKDEWTLTPKGWRLLTSQVAEQDFQR